MKEKKILVVDQGTAVITGALKAMEVSEGALIITVNSPGGSIGSPPPALDVDSITFTPKYFPPSKSKFHK